MSVGQDNSLEMRILLVDALGRLRTFDEWESHLAFEITNNDSDKSIAVPNAQEWIIQSIYVDYTATATVGNRQVTVELQDDSSNIIAIVKTGAVQAGSLQRYYTFAPQLPDLTSFRDTSFLMTPIPDILLDEYYIIRVYDSTAVDAAADDVHVFVVVKQRAKEA